MSDFPLQLKNYFFTHQEVTANPDYKIGEQARNQYDIESSIVKMTDNQSGVQVTVTTNAEMSNNHSYFVKITVFGVMDIIQKISDIELDKTLKTDGTQLLIGVIRDHLASMTARGPWPPCFIDFVHINL